MKLIKESPLFFILICTSIIYAALYMGQYTGQKEEKKYPYRRFDWDKIDEAIEKIINADFNINPKRIGMDNVGCEFCPFRDICFMKEEMIENEKEKDDVII